MELARSTYYDEPQGQPIAEARLVERIKEICAEWPSYGYRRVTAQLHAEGMIVNHKKVMRLMQENGLSVRPRRRFMVPPTAITTGRSFRTWRRTWYRQGLTSSGLPRSAGVVI
jgi:putative transposase